MKKEFQIISELIESGTRVLDVGCGDGILIKHLKDTKSIDTRGLEIAKSNVQICISDSSLTPTESTILFRCSLEFFMIDDIN